MRFRTLCIPVLGFLKAGSLQDPLVVFLSSVTGLNDKAVPIRRVRDFFNHSYLQELFKLGSGDFSVYDGCVTRAL